MDMTLVDAQPGFVHYLPIATTVLSAAFCTILFSRYAQRGGAHLLWWGLGIFFYGLGTGLESTITLFGNTVALNKAWYIAGALLGGYPLAQGTVYLLLDRRIAHALSAVTLPFIAVVSALVILSPVEMSALEPHRPGGAILGWSWVRLTTPFINGYAALFLIGGAILSATRYARLARYPATGCARCGYELTATDVESAGDIVCPECGSASTPASRTAFARRRAAASRSRALGNASIAFGALLPGIGGGMAKAGIVEALYIGELIGLLFIWLGYWLCVRSPMRPPSTPAESTPTRQVQPAA